MAKKTMGQQFSESLRQWGKGFPLREFRVDEPPTETFRGAGDYADAMVALLYMNTGRIFFEIQQAWRCAEDNSPIEVPMLFALAVVGHGNTGSVRYRVDGEVRGSVHGGGLTIEPQAQIGDYRVDFLLTYLEEFPLVEGGVRRKEGSLVVECDGHDFHDRTKEQAKKDRQRDRALQSMGFPVYRYTGSEIWHDVFACAQEAVTALATRVQDQVGDG